MRPRARLVALLVVLVGVGVTVAVLQPVDRSTARDLLGGWGVPGFVVVGAVLACLFVPGAVLAAAAGLLFGTGMGFVAALGSALLTSVLAVQLSGRVGRAGVEDLTDRRVRGLERLLQARPVAGVVVARLLPSVPDAPCTYLFGLAGLATWQVVVGTAIGAAPRAFSYAVLGDAAGDRNGGQAVAGAVVLVATGALGAFLGWQTWRRDVRPRTSQGKG